MRDAGVSTKPAHSASARRVLSSYILLPALAASVLAGGFIAPGAINPSAAFAQTPAPDDDVPVGPAATLGVLAAMRARRAAAAAAEAAAMKPAPAPPAAAAVPKVAAAPAAEPVAPATTVAVSRPEAAAARKTPAGTTTATQTVASVEATNAPHAAHKTPDASPAARAALTSAASAAVPPSAAASAPAAAPEVVTASAEKDAVAVDAPVASRPGAGEAEVAPVGPAATVGALASARAAMVSDPPAQEGPTTGSSDGDEAVMLSAAASGYGLAVPDSAPPALPPADTSAGGAAPEAGASPGATPSPAAASGAVPVSAAPDAAASPAPVAPAPPEGGPRTFLINDGAPPPAPGSAFPVMSGAPAPIASDPASGEQIVTPEEAPTDTTVILPASQRQSVEPAAATPENASQVVNYEENQQMPLNEPQLHSLQEFMNEGANTSPLGVELQEGARQTKNGREIDGLLVVSMQPGSPADRAGVQAGHRAAHDVIEGAAVAASLVFPPAVLAVPVIETIQLGENYDLIIGVDGNRVTNFMDFQDQLRDARPGETVYLNILRGGRRLQLPVEMPPPDPRKLQP